MHSKHVPSSIFIFWLERPTLPWQIIETLKEHSFNISSACWLFFSHKASKSGLLRCFIPEIGNWCLFLQYIPEKAMAPHSSTLAWKIPWMEEPGWLQSMGSWRVRYDWVTSLSLITFMHWRRKWQPTPVFLPGEAQGRRSLVGCRLWGRTESDTTEAT